MKKIFTLLLLISMHASAQRPFVKEESIHQQIIIKYGSATGANAIIKTLAEGNGKQLQNTQFTISCDQKITTATGEGLQQSVIESGELNITGDVFYKGFEIKNFLIPSHVQFTFKTWNGNTLLASFPFNGVNVNNSKPEKKETAYDDSPGKVTRHTIEKFLPAYTSNDLQQFNDRVIIIKQYFSDAARLAKSLTLLHSIDPNDIEHFTIQQQKFTDASLAVSEIESRNYNSRLLLQQFDPAKMLNNLSLFNSQATSLQQDLDFIYSTLHFAYYDRGMDLLREGNTASAKNYFNQSLADYPGFAPALLQLAVIDYRDKNFPEAISKTDDILFRFDPDPDTRRLTYQLLNDIYESQLDKAAEQINNREYHKALEFYDLAKSICDKYTNVRCGDELFKGIRTAKNGIYIEYLESAKVFSEKKQFDKAEQSVGDAISYQRNNKTDITDDSEARKSLKEVSRQRYFAMMEEGKQALSSKQFETALNAFDAATQMETDFGFTADTELPSLKTNAARPLMAIMLDNADSLVKIDKLTEARNIVRTIAGMQAKYSLKPEIEFNKRLEEWRQKIFSPQCENAQREFDTEFLYAKDAVSGSGYIKADGYFINAEKINEQNKDCELNTRNIIEEHAAIVHAATYLKMMIQVNTLQWTMNYHNAQSVYEEAGKYFAANNVSRFNIVHESFYGYLSHKGSNGFLFYAAGQYTATNELDKALNILRLLLNRNYDNKQLKGSLYQLGIKSGRKDKLDHPGEKYSSDYVQEYTNGDRRMKSFEKGYKKGWKK